MVGERLGVLPIIGTMLMLSVPAAIITSASPTRMRSAAICTAERPEAQKRLTVIPPTELGRPARMAPMRATFRPCCASGMAQPQITSSTAFGSRPGTWAMAERRACASRSSGRRCLNEPLCERPMGVRVAATM
ncbi:hypothetical protein FQZ97_839830 [compost metagenome]